MLWNGQKAGGLSLRVKRGERVEVWWLDGVDVSDGFVSNTLSLLVSAMSTHPSMVSHSPVCFKAIVFVATSTSVCAAVLSHFCLLSNPILIGNCHLLLLAQ